MKRWDLELTFNSSIHSMVLYDAAPNTTRVMEARGHLRSQREHDERERPRRQRMESLAPSDEDAASDKWNIFSWLQGVGVHRAVANAILHEAQEHGLSASPEDALEFVRVLKRRDEVGKLLRSESALEALTDLVWSAVTSLQCAGAATSTEMQSKFAGSVELSYGGLDSFFGGLEGVVGSPNPKLLEAMAADHMSGPGTESADMFVTGNCEPSTRF